MPTLSTYWLPPPLWKPKGKPYKSTFKMTREEAAKRGLTDADIVPGTTEEITGVGTQSAGFDGPRDGQLK